MSQIKLSLKLSILISHKSLKRQRSPQKNIGDIMNYLERNAKTLIHPNQELQITVQYLDLFLAKMLQQSQILQLRSISCLSTALSISVKNSSPLMISFISKAPRIKIWSRMRPILIALDLANSQNLTR